MASAPVERGLAQVMLNLWIGAMEALWLEKRPY